MPYIPENQRIRLIDYVTVETASPGKMAFLMTQMLVEKIRHLLNLNQPVGYAELMKWHGVVQSVADEFKRRVIDPYEDMKEKENGDVGYSALIARLCNQDKGKEQDG